MLDYAFGFILGNIWSLCFLAVAIYIYFFRKENKPSFQMALILAGAYGLSQIVYTQFILPHKNLYDFYYLYWSGATAVVAISLFVNHKIKGFIFHWPIKLALSLLALEVLLILAVHVDRNVIALNSSVTANRGLEDAWWLWNVQSMFTNFDNLVILISIMLPLSFGTKHDTFQHSNSSAQMDEAFKRIKELKDMVSAMPDGLQKSLARQCITTAEFLLSQWNGEGEDRQHLYCANLLCDRARTLSLYVSDAVPKKLSQDENKAVNVDY